MQLIKIAIIIIVVGILGYILYSWLAQPPLEGDIPKVRNEFVNRIQSEIDSLKRYRTDQFANVFYKDIKYRLSDYNNSKMLGDNESNNGKWYTILSKNLFTTYANVFVEQANTQLQKPVWSNQDIALIDQEIDSLTASDLLEDKSTVYNKLQVLNKSLNKYYEINSFLESVNKYGYSDLSISSKYPINGAQQKIIRAKQYLTNNLEDSLVQNCISLKEKLDKINEILYAKHINYLERKIRAHSDKLDNYSSQPEYSEKMYEPMSAQISDLDTYFEIYGISENYYYAQKEKLLELLELDNAKAYDYY